MLRRDVVDFARLLVVGLRQSVGSVQKTLLGDRRRFHVGHRPARHPNQGVIDSITKIDPTTQQDSGKLGRLKQKVFLAWESLYARQKKEDFFPKFLDDDFKKALEKLQLPKGELDPKFLDVYQNHVKESLPPLQDIVKVRHESWGRGDGSRGALPPPRPSARRRRHEARRHHAAWHHTAWHHTAWHHTAGPHAAAAGQRASRRRNRAAGSRPLSPNFVTNFHDVLKRRKTLFDVVLIDVEKLGIEFTLG